MTDAERKLKELKELSDKFDALKSSSPTPPKDQSFDSLFSYFSGEGGSDLEVYVIAFLAIFFVICSILIPVNIYFGQRHARLCRDELRKQTVILKNIQTDLEFKPERNPYGKEM
jgi:hypothetical protein